MNDILTEQIIQKLNELPIIKKKAILELIKEDSPTISKDNKELSTKWRSELLNTSVWSESEIEEIYKAREYINTWKPKQYF